MYSKIHLCIQSQKGFYIFSQDLDIPKNLFAKEKLLRLNLNQRDEWIAKITPKETFIAEKISFVMKEILSKISFLTQDLLLLPYCQEGFFIEIFNDDSGGLICNFLYHQSLKEFVKKYDLYVRFGETHLLLPFHIQELELQELFLINQNRSLCFKSLLKIAFLLF